MGAAAVVAGVLPQFEELLDVQVPGFQIGAHRALALSALVHRHGGVVDHLQERNHALRLAVGALDMRAQGAHRRPVVAQAARVLGQQGIVLDRFVNAVEVVRDRGQIAARELRAQRARIEQGRRRTHEVERGQHLVELDGARLAVDLVQRQAHGHAHEERLRQFDALPVIVQEVAVIQGLQAEIAEFQIARGVQRLAQARQVELGQPLVQQFRGDAALDEFRKILGVALGHLRLRHFLAQDLDADGVQQQPRGDEAVGRILFDQRARRQDRRLADLLDRHAVVQILQRLVENDAADRPHRPDPRSTP